MNEVLKVIISGGGTGGHIFPAVSIANEIRAKRPDAEILFVGDQIQTDVRAANGAGIRVLLSEPLWPKEPIWTKLNRFFEKMKRKKVNLMLKGKDWKEALTQ